MKKPPLKPNAYVLPKLPKLNGSGRKKRAVPRKKPDVKRKKPLKLPVLKQKPRLNGSEKPPPKLNA